MTTKTEKNMKTLQQTFMQIERAAYNISGKPWTKCYSDIAERFDRLSTAALHRLERIAPANHFGEQYGRYALATMLDNAISIGKLRAELEVITDENPNK